ncbi:hypothetical protein M0M57_11690 [Flavobacterium azooxidireducens]|uniref:Outer membrane protein beta-barrel domain-containing protein n=1 Tax=Flavobacterium azooxidireducens TaxID=1871076 RepID=A0ABY4KFW7_9FLAO|nr:hypothetical protein [Flavobacterium azooxidireducens]UPQ78280.1 hypothetical protein M0M57_11690 [Flavobacterium azooxidireducens]
METIFTRFFLIIVFCCAISSFGQTPPTVKDSLRNTTRHYILDTRRNLNDPSRPANVTTYLATPANLDLYYDELYFTFNPKMLNIFFENEINSFATNITDLNLDKYIVSASTENKTLTIGRNIDLRNLRKIFFSNEPLPIRPINNLVSIYVKNKLDKGFSNIYSQNSKSNEYDFNSDFGIGLKFTHIFNGIIRYGDNSAHSKKEGIRRIREEIIIPTINEEINKYIKFTPASTVVTNINSTKSSSINSGVETTNINAQTVSNGVSSNSSTTSTSTTINPDTNSNTTTSNTTTTISTPSRSSNNEEENINAILYCGNDLTDKNEKLIKEKYYFFYKKIADKEIEILKKEKLYSSYLTWWVGFDAYYGASGKETYFKKDLTPNTIVDTAKFRDYKIDLYVNGLWSFSKGVTINAKLQFNSTNTNNFIINEKTANTFETIASLPNNQQTVTGTQLVFIGQYDEFIVLSTRYELSFLVFNNTVGLSGALEHYYGTFKARNWKFGIPVSFKDKDKKPTLNFELQWKEINRNHFVGISVGYAFGKFLK